MMRILFAGDSWQGSSARSLREAMAVNPETIISDIGLDQFLPNYSELPLRIANRLLRPLQVRELNAAILRSLAGARPDVFVVYKGIGIEAALIEHVRRLGIPTVNIFPDQSPHAHGHLIKEAVGCYDLVVTTKPYHPTRWQSMYGYHNKCVCVPHGYDPAVHWWARPAESECYDVALCAAWRPEYHRLMRAFGEALANRDVSVAIAGVGWKFHQRELPSHWKIDGPRLGRAYGDFLRSARIALAPVMREVFVDGMQQPGDEETTRTYELASAYCFFIHQRTDFVKTLYDESTEVPLWTDGAEMAALVRRWLPDEPGRRAMAARAHARAVPAYSIPQRAAQVLQHIQALIRSNTGLQSA